MGIFYPDNQKRADRLQQVISNVTNMQKTAGDEYDSIARAERNMKDNLNKIMRDQKLADLDQLKDKILKEMTPEARAEFEKLIKATRDFSETSDAIILCSGLIANVAQIAGAITEITVFVKSVSVLRVMKQYARCFKLMITEGLEVGLKALKGLRAGLKVLAVEFKAASTFGKVLGVISKVADFVQWAAVGIELVTLISQIIVEGEQRDKLISAIHDALVSRISVSFFSAELKKATEFTVAMDLYLDALANPDPDAPDEAKGMAKRLGRKIQQGVETVTVSDELKKWKTIDDNVKAYTSDDWSSDTIETKVNDEIKKFEEEVKKEAEKKKDG